MSRQQQPIRAFTILSANHSNQVNALLRVFPSRRSCILQHHDEESKIRTITTELHHSFSVASFLQAAGTHTASRLTEFKVAARLIYSANLDAEALCYVMLAARPLWVSLLALSTITSHTQPPNASTAPYCLWALVRAHMTLLLLLSKCDFRPDFISLLPTEVLTQIFGNAFTDLPSLSKVSRRFHEIVQPELYKTVHFSKKPQQSCSHPLLLFMRTIGNNPDLAKQVRLLELGYTREGLEMSGHLILFTRFPKEEEIVIANMCADYVQNVQLSWLSNWGQDLKIKKGSLYVFKTDSKMF